MDLGLALFPTVLDRVLRYGDGWIPNRLDGLADRLTELRERAGRHVPVTYFGAPARPEAIESMREAGVDRALLMLPSDGADRAQARVDQLAELL